MKRIFTTLSDKWPEYLIEAIVIVASIYGAFTLENWNEGRKERKNELDLLQNLQSDFNIRLTEIDDIQKVRTEIITSIDTLFSIADGRKPYPADSIMDQMLFNLYISYRFNDEFSSLDMLFATGAINAISNSKLKSLLIKWPWLVQEMIEEQDRIEDQLRELQLIMSKYVVANNLMKSAPWIGLDIATDLSSSHFPTDYRGLLNDKQFIDMVTHKRSYLLFNVKDGREIIKHGQIILDEIEKEINK